MDRFPKKLKYFLTQPTSRIGFLIDKIDEGRKEKSTKLLDFLFKVKLLLLEISVEIEQD